MKLIRLDEADVSLGEDIDEVDQLLINDVISYYGTQLSDEEVEDLVANLHRQAHDIIARKSKVNDMVNSDDMDDLIHDWETEISDEQSDYEPGEEILDPSRVRRREPGGDLYLNDEDSPSQRVDRRLAKKKLRKKQRKTKKPTEEELMDLDEPLPDDSVEDEEPDEDTDQGADVSAEEVDSSEEESSEKEEKASKSKEKNEMYRISGRRRRR